MADMIEVNTSELSKEAKRMRKLLSSYNKAVRSVYNDCLNQINTAWKSNDNQEFIHKLSGYKKDLDDAGKWMERYIETLEYAVMTYEDARVEAARVAASGRG